MIRKRLGVDRVRQGVRRWRLRGMVVGLITYRARAGRTLGPIGTTPAGSVADQARARRISLGALGVIALVVVLGLLGVITVNALAIANMMKNIILGMAVLYFTYLFFFAGLNLESAQNFVL